MKRAERSIETAVALVAQAVALLTEAGQHEAVHYLKHGVALLSGTAAVSQGGCAMEAMVLLRSAFLQLEREGEIEAADDVASALQKLGEPFPELSDLEASAQIDVWIAEEDAPKGNGAAKV